MGWTPKGSRSTTLSSRLVLALTWFGRVCRVKTTVVGLEVKTQTRVDFENEHSLPIMSHPLVIHATPPLAPLPASDIDSIYLISVAQLQCPGRWSLTTGGWGDNRGESEKSHQAHSIGDLPYITHLDRPVAPSHLPHPDADLSPADRAEALAWVAYIDAKVSDLVVSPGL